MYRKQVEASLEEAKKDNVRVPQTVEEYTATVQKRLIQSTSSNDYDDMIDYDDDYMQSSDDEDLEDGEQLEDSEEEYQQGEGDSGMA